MKYAIYKPLNAKRYLIEHYGEPVPFFAVLNHEWIDTATGPAVQWNGTDRQEMWGDPAYTDLVWGILTTRDNIPRIYYWQEKYWVAGVSSPGQFDRSGPDRWMIRITGHNQYNMGLVAYELDNVQPGT